MSNDINRNDIGEPLDKHSTKAGFSSYQMASLYQKFVRRGDKEKAMFAAFEMTRSGYESMFWSRVTTIIIEDLSLPPEEAYLLSAVERLRTLATDVFDDDEWMQVATAMRCAAILAEAESERSLLPMQRWWRGIAEDRLEALKQNEKLEHDFPVAPFGSPHSDHAIEFVCADKHTAEGSRAGRGTKHYFAEASRTSEPSELEQQHKELVMHHELDSDEEVIEHGVSPVPDDQPWHYDRRTGFE